MANSCHIGEDLIDALNAGVGPAPLMTGAICQKSLSLTRRIPPKGLAECFIAQQMLFAHSITAMLALGSSSHMMADVLSMAQHDMCLGIFWSGDQCYSADED